MQRFQYAQWLGRHLLVRLNWLIFGFISFSLVFSITPMTVLAADNPYNTDVFVRGTMNAWGTAHKMTFQDGVFTAVLMLDAKNYEFKVASADWAMADFGAGSDGHETALDVVKVFARKGANVKLTLTEAGLYQFTADVADPEQPKVTVQKADSITVTIHYRRAAGDYEGWGMHLWNQDPPALAVQETEDVTWESPRAFDGEDEFGKFATLQVANPSAAFGFGFHKGDERDQHGADMFLTVAQDGFEVWIAQGSDQKFSNPAEAIQASLGLPDLYVRGSMNDWNATNKMAAKGTQFTAILALDAGPLEFKIAGADWAQADFGGGGDSAVVLGAPQALTIKGGNLKFEVLEQGMYQFLLDAANPSAPTLTVQKSQVALIHYQRKNKDYAGWALHLWNFDPPALAQSVIEGITWDKPRPFDGEDDFGPYAFLELVDPNAQFGFIIHNGNEKDHGGLDMTLTPATEGFETWMVQGSQEKFTNKEDALVAGGAVGNLREAAARWISRDTIVWQVDPAKGMPYLYYDPDGKLTLENGVITVGPNGREIPLAFKGNVGTCTLNDYKLAYLPHLTSWPRIDTSSLTAAEALLTNPLTDALKKTEETPSDAVSSQIEIRTLLTGALAIALKNPEGQLVDATSLQLAGILDDLFPYNGDLGVTFDGDAPTLRVWAPTAQSVRLVLLDSP